jgi:hypothetical protein
MLHSLILIVSIDCLPFAEIRLIIFQYNLSHLDCEFFSAILFNFSFLTPTKIPRERHTLVLMYSSHYPCETNMFVVTILRFSGIRDHEASPKMNLIHHDSDISLISTSSHLSGQKDHPV